MRPAAIYLAVDLDLAVDLSPQRNDIDPERIRSPPSYRARATGPPPALRGPAFLSCQRKTPLEKIEKGELEKRTAVGALRSTLEVCIKHVILNTKSIILNAKFIDFNANRYHSATTTTSTPRTDAANCAAFPSMNTLHSSCTHTQPVRNAPADSNHFRTECQQAATKGQAVVRIACVRMNSSFRYSVTSSLFGMKSCRFSMSHTMLWLQKSELRSGESFWQASALCIKYTKVSR